MEVHTKLGVLQHPHPSSVIPVTHHANSAQSKACLRRPGLHPGRKQNRRALPYNPLLPPRAQEAGTEELSLPPDLRLLAEVVQGFAPPGTPFVTASADKPGSRPLTCRDSQGAGGIQRAGGDIYRDEPRGVTLNTDERSLIIVIRHANSCIYRDASRIINPCPASMETQQ